MDKINIDFDLTIQALSENRSNLTLQPIKNILRKRFFGWSPKQLQSIAAKSWEFSPSEKTISPPAFYFSNQLERVTGWAFASEHPRHQMEGQVISEHTPTMAYLIKDAWLIDDYATYQLAKNFGAPVNTTKNIDPHTYSYKVQLGMAPLQYENVFLKNLLSLMILDKILISALDI